MTPKEAFKLGFAVKMAQMGITPSMAEASLEKQAGPIPGAVRVGGATAAGALGLTRSALGLWLGPALVAGGLLGYKSGRVEGPEPPDIDALKEKERVNIIRRAIRDLHRQQGGVL